MAVLTKAHSHRDGARIVGETTQKELVATIRSSSAVVRVHGTANIRRTMIEALKSTGWSGSVPITPGSAQRVTSTREGVALCVETGNTAALYRDLFKLLLLHSRGAIRAGVIVLPTRRAASVLGNNYASLELLIEELEVYRSIVNVPLFLIGFDSET